MSVERYRKKRDFAKTPEPAGEGARDAGGARFVVQEHHATRLHWDLRLEHDGALASWAVPNGIPPDPAENRLAVRTEDHPLEYLEFEGDMPKGQYGAGTMRIWDRGTFEVHKWEERKVEVTFHGERLRGRYGLFPIGRAGETKNDWMIHRMAPPEDPDRVPMPERVLPMLARSSQKLPPDQKRWSFEVKWDGVRAIAYAQPGRLRLESRNLNEITNAYPEVRGILDDLGMHEAVLDGEIVAFDDAGKPSFERLQRRMHVTSPSVVRRLAASVPVAYAIFDLLYLDGRSLMVLPYGERRARLELPELGGKATRVPAADPGVGKLLLGAPRAQGLEGLVAKAAGSVDKAAPESSTAETLKSSAPPGSPEALFDRVERLTEDAILVEVDGRELRITNWDKVLFPQAGFTKGDLIAYYARIAPAVLPHLHDRPLTLKRYPNGVDAQYFYEKQSPKHRPEWVQTARMGGIDYTLAQD